MKERIKEVFSTFFISVTLINIAMLVLGSILSPDQKFGYEVFMYPVIYGLISMIPGLIMNTQKELTVKQALIRHIFQMLLIIALLLAFIFGGRPINAELIKLAAGVAISIAIVYILVITIQWLLDSKTAKNMPDDLMKYQQRKE